MLKLTHHGSKASSSDEFLAIAGLGMVFISIGENTYSYPLQETLNRLARVMNSDCVFRTDEDGRAEIISDGSILWLELEE